MAEHSGEKSQDATPHRRQQAREQGQVVKSQDLGSAVLLILGLLALVMMGSQVSDFFADYLKRQLSGPPRISVDATYAMNEWTYLLWRFASCVLPILALLVVGAIVTNLAQVGFLFLPDRAAPDLTRLDPLKGFGRIFSRSNLARLGFGLFKVVLVLTVAGVSLYNDRQTLLGLSALGLPQIAAYLAEVVIWTSLKVALALLILAVVDYFFQRWQYEQDLKMTPQEVREEMKNLEGDPQIIARRRAVQRQLVLNRMSTAVPKADVVVTNPTELAVAIQYDPGEMAAPVVVAKGAGSVAERIRRMALEHGIPIIEKKPLAQALYKEVEVGRPIPQERYAAVAEILAYVYQLKGKKVPGAA